ncbi:hypothetical protein TWF718_008494 [Orbilia javanica]|uniref:Zn(2)-C6 fungal-type domain-containing protein n=1 Tax=Orbilia javanica TaxID=47235 RepID=A0AAN8RHE0_9PEZI
MAVQGLGTGDVAHVDFHVAAAAPSDKRLPMADADILSATSHVCYLNTPPTTPDQILPAASGPSLAASSSRGHLQKPVPILPSRPDIDTDTMATNHTTMACARCKQKKIKASDVAPCDGRHPSCSACKRAGVDCTVPDIISQTGLARGHVEKLETRVSELQSLIDTKTRELKEKQSRQSSLSSAFTSCNSPIPSNPFTTGKRSSATSTQQSNLWQTPTPLHQQDHLQADISLARLLVQTLHLKDHGPCISKLSHLVANERSTAFESINAAENLPLEPIGDILCKSYLENEHICFPFLSRREIIRLYKSIYSSSGGIDHANVQEYFCLYMIFAIACLSHPPGVEDPQENALRFYKAALICRERLPPASTLSAVQNTLLLCLFSMHAKISQDAWRLSRRALHVSIEAEFHLSRRDRNPQHETRLAQIQKRAFWSAYCLNRITSNLIYDRPPSIPEASIDAEMTSELQLDPDNTKSLTVSLLPSLARLYGISTSAFTSFNSLDPPPGDTVTQLEIRLNELSECRAHLLELLQTAFPERVQSDSWQDIDWIPFYVTLSSSAHPMLMCQWAMTAIAAKYDGVPLGVQTLTLKCCIETIQFIGKESSSFGLAGYEPQKPKFGHLRIAFLIMLRGLIILLSALLAKEYRTIGVTMQDGGDVSHEDIDKAIVIGIRFLRDVGPGQGQNCAFIPALVLALRYAVFEKLFGQAPGILFLREEYHYRMIEERVKGLYPGLFQLSMLMDVSSLPIGIGLMPLEEELEADFPSMNVFKKFGDSAGELEELSRVVRWRLKVQYEVGDSRESLRAFEERMGVNRVMEVGNVGFSALAGFNVYGELGGRRETRDSSMGYDFAQDFSYSISGSGTGMKMDVDFSGFETDIITFE